MNSFRLMEWNSKWDWENLDMFNSKASESPQKLQPTDWGIVEGEMDASSSFNLSGGGGGGGGGGSGSDLGHGSSAKSSISASTDCSSKQGIPTSTFTFEPFKGFPKDFSKKNELIAGAELNDTSPSSLDASVGSGEPLIGLKLGKRTYFENSSCTGSNSKTTSSFSVNPPASSASTARKIKISSSSSSSCPKGALTPRCQVEGCNLDLSSAKEYHRKHRVCETHSKSSKVVVAGLERRFCQQCSRFHGLSEFDEKKRSCRRRLSDHNARRRKPQQETLHFSSTRLSSTSYDGKQQQMSFVLNNFPHSQSRPGAMNSTWESTYTGYKCTQSKGFHLLKPENFIDGQHHQQPLPGTQLPPAFSMPNHESTSRSMLPPCRATPSAAFGQDFKDPTFSSNIDAAPDFRRALSLLSTSTTTNSWDCSYEPDPSEPTTTTLEHHHQPMHVSHTNMMMSHQHMTHQQVPPQGLPLASSTSSEYWQAEPHNHSNDVRVHALASSAAAADNSSSALFHLFKAPPQQARFYPNQLN